MDNRNQYTNLIYQGILALGDAVLLYVALWLALALRYQTIPAWELLTKHAEPFTAVFLLWLFLFYSNRLYDLARVRDQLNIYFDITRALLIGTLIAVIVFYMFPDSDLTPKRLLVIDAGIFALLMSIWRAVFVKLWHASLPQNRVAIVGITLRSLELGRYLLAHPASGYKLYALVGDGITPVETPANLQQTKIIASPYDLMPAIHEDGIDTLVLATDELNPGLVNQLVNYLPLHIKFYSLPDFYEEVTYKVPVARLNQAWFLNNINERDKRSYDLIKRGFDALVAFGLLVILSPLLIISALLIVLESRGPVIYQQTRVGAKNKLFTIYKLRTMVANAESQGAVWAQKNDARITGVGQILRKTRLDEIPQLVNVLRGEMSMIGPRPERPEFVNDLAAKIPFYQTRHLIKPGLTGWAQVKFPYGASVEDAKEKLQYDLYYIKHRSLSLDLSILIRTLVTVLGFQGR